VITCVTAESVAAIVSRATNATSSRTSTAASCAVGVTPANAPEARVSAAIAGDLARQRDAELWMMTDPRAVR
jgi:hypothetical protein